MKVWDGSSWLDAYASLSGALLAANNLSDLTNTGTARTNLGLGTAATTAATDYATAAQGTKADSALQPAAIGVSVQAYDADLATIAGLTPTNNYAIIGNGTSWTSSALPTPASTLDDLTDVVITSPATDQVLKYDGTNWVNGTGGSGGGGQFFGTAAVKAIAYNANTIGENLTVTTGNNGYSAGPITISSTFTVTVETGAVWTII
jgi:hypothetical protein